jgi:hypothetical protein
MEEAQRVAAARRYVVINRLLGLTRTLAPVARLP